MSLGTDLAAAVAAAQADQLKLHAIVNGPATGGTSLVTLADGITVVKTLARIAAESTAFGIVTTPAINSGTSTLVLDLALSGNFLVANNHAVTTLTISNPLAAQVNSFQLLLTADGTPRAWTFPGSVTWLNGAPTLTSTNAKRDWFNFVSFDGGTTWLGIVIAQGF